MSNEALILVPGLLCTRALFAPQVDVLAPSVRIIVADHTRDDAMEAIASRLLAAAPTRFALAGLSMGGYVALEVLRQAPQRVTRLALLETSPRPTGRPRANAASARSRLRRPGDSRRSRRSFGRVSSTPIDS